VTRREWLATLAAAPLAYAAPANPEMPVAIAKCGSYDEDIAAKLDGLFDRLGGIAGLVRNKTVTVKINMTGPTSQHFQGRALGVTHYTHPKVVGAVAFLMGRAGARRIRFVESAWATGGPLEDVILDSGWNLRALQSAAAGVEFENTNALGQGTRYSRFRVPGAAYMFPAYDLNHSYEDTDVFVSLAKLKNHEICGVTLSLKNCYGILPASVYGDDTGADEPNESPTKGRTVVGHEGNKRPPKSAPQELRFGDSHDPGYRVPHIVADLAAARPIHLAIIDGVESMAGGEGPWISGLRIVKPGVLIAGLNPVATDAVAAAVMGYNPRAARGTSPFRACDNTLLLAESHGVGTADLKRIEVRGVSIEQALYRYDT
jgi:uncharacterized protein (DUF362 family)